MQPMSLACRLVCDALDDAVVAKSGTYVHTLQVPPLYTCMCRCHLCHSTLCSLFRMNSRQALWISWYCPIIEHSHDLHDHTHCQTHPVRTSWYLSTFLHHPHSCITPLNSHHVAPPHSSGIVLHFRAGHDECSPALWLLFFSGVLLPHLGESFCYAASCSVNSDMKFSLWIDSMAPAPVGTSLTMPYGSTLFETIIFVCRCSAS